MGVPRRGPLLRLFWLLHKALWNLSRGRWGRRVAGMPVLELRTIGRKSGRERSSLLNFVEHGDGYAVIGSNVGHHAHPSWYLNLQASPLAWVRRDGHTRQVVARTATGEERAELWERFLAANRAYEAYALRARERELPIVVLEPG